MARPAVRGGLRHAGEMKGLVQVKVGDITSKTVPGINGDPSRRYHRKRYDDTLIMPFLTAFPPCEKPFAPASKLGHFFARGVAQSVTTQSFDSPPCSCMRRTLSSFDKDQGLSDESLSPCFLDLKLVEPRGIEPLTS